MSYHGRMNVVECSARMKAIDVGRARRRLEKDDIGVESCFLDEMRKAAEAAIDEGLSDAWIDVPKGRCWFSGNHVNAESLLPLAPMLSGTLSGYFTGEDGSLYGGFVIEDGHMFAADVTVTLDRKSSK